VTHRPNIFIICQPCPNPNGRFVQRFKWQDGVWIPSDTSKNKWYRVGGPQLPFTSPEEIADAPAGHNHLTLRCDYCGSGGSMNWHMAQITLTRLWVKAESFFKERGINNNIAQPLKFTLRQFQKAFDALPRWAVNAIPGHQDNQTSTTVLDPAEEHLYA